jgi:hypothetical protein
MQDSWTYWPIEQQRLVYTLFLKSMLIADSSVENMNPGVTPNGMLLDISLLLKKKWKKIQQTSNFN